MLMFMVIQHVMIFPGFFKNILSFFKKNVRKAMLTISLKVCFSLNGGCCSFAIVMKLCCHGNNAVLIGPSKICSHDGIPVLFLYFVCYH